MKKFWLELALRGRFFSEYDFYDNEQSPQVCEVIAHKLKLELHYKK